MGVAVRVAGLCRRFEAAVGLPGVGPLDLEVAAGETFAVLGPSGSGKSTLVRLLAGLDPPDSGSISLDGRDATRLDPVARGVAVAFDDAPLHPHLDVAANLRLGLGALGLLAGDREASLEKAIAAFGIAGLLDRSPETLSAGERRRVCLARTIARRPRLLLLDEPLGNLDGPARLSLREALRAALGDLGATAFLVTHDHEVATGLATRIGFLDGGRLVQVGTADELWRTPAHRAVATGFGPEPMAAVPDGEGSLAFRSARASIAAAPPPASRAFPVERIEPEFGGDSPRLRVTLRAPAGAVIVIPAGAGSTAGELVVPIGAIHHFDRDGRRIDRPIS